MLYSLSKGYAVPKERIEEAFKKTPRFSPTTS